MLMDVSLIHLIPLLEIVYGITIVLDVIQTWIDKIMNVLDYFKSLLLNNKKGECILLDGTYYLVSEDSHYLLSVPALFNKLPNAKDAMDNVSSMDEAKYKVLMKRSKSGLLKGTLMLLNQGEGYYVLVLSIPYKKPKKGDKNGVLVLKCGNSLHELDSSLKSVA